MLLFCWLSSARLHCGLHCAAPAVPPTLLLQHHGQQQLLPAQRPQPRHRRAAPLAAAAEAASLEEQQQQQQQPGSSENGGQPSTSGRGAAPALKVRGAKVVVQDMVKHFETRRGLFKAVNGASVDMEPGTITALLGPSGSGAAAGLRAATGCLAARLKSAGSAVAGEAGRSAPAFPTRPNSCRLPAGKTTLLRLIAGLEEPTAGRVFFDGEDITGRSVPDRDLGFVFQVRLSGAPASPLAARKEEQGSGSAAASGPAGRAAPAARGPLAPDAALLLDSPRRSRPRPCRRAMRCSST